MQNNSSKHPKHYASKFRIYLGLGQIIPNGVWTQVLLDNITIDVLNECDVAIAHSFTPTQTGYYILFGCVCAQTTVVPAVWTVGIYINAGASQYGGQDTSILNGYVTVHVNTLVHLNAGDVVTMQVRQNSGVNQLIGVDNRNYLWGVRVG